MIANRWLGPFSRGSSLQSPYWSGWPCDLRLGHTARQGQRVVVASWSPVHPAPSDLFGLFPSLRYCSSLHHLLSPMPYLLCCTHAPWGLWGHLSHLRVTHSAWHRPAGDTEQTFSEGVKRQIRAGLCPEPAEVMGLILTFSQRVRKNVVTGGQRRAWVFALFSPVFPSCSFCFKILIIWERTKGSGRSHKITSRNLLYHPIPRWGENREESSSQSPDSSAWGGVGALGQS